MASLKRLYNTPTPAVGFALFRIAFALVYLGEVSQIYRYRTIVFDYIPHYLPYQFSQTPALLIWILSIVFIALGLFTRAAAVVNYVMALAVIAPAANFEYHADYTYTNVAFLLMFFPMNETLSLDSLFKRASLGEHYSRPALSRLHYQFFIFLCLGILYFDSIFHKFGSQTWLSGLGIWKPASYPMANYWDTSQFMDMKILMLLGCYITLAFESLLIFLMWFNWARLPLMLLGLGLHIGIFIAFPIPYFALIVATIYLLLMPWNSYDWLDKKLVPAWEQATQGIVDYLKRFITAIKPSEPKNTRDLYPFRLMLVLSSIFVIFQLNALLLAPQWGLSENFKNSFVRKVTGFSAATLGVNAHAVFVDHFWVGYNHIVGITHIKDDGSEEWLPIVNEQGLATGYNSGRLWAFSTFRYMNNRIMQQRVLIGARKFTAFWAREKGYNLADLKFKIKVKKVDVPDNWTPGILAKNIGQPWIDAGEASWEKGQFKFNVKNIEEI